MEAVKLSPNLTDRREYTVHYYVLDLYTKLGLRVKKIHDVRFFIKKPSLNLSIFFGLIYFIHFFYSTIGTTV